MVHIIWDGYDSQQNFAVAANHEMQVISEKKI